VPGIKNFYLLSHINEDVAALSVNIALDRLQAAGMVRVQGLRGLLLSWQALSTCILLCSCCELNVFQSHTLSEQALPGKKRNVVPDLPADLRLEAEDGVTLALRRRLLVQQSGGKADPVSACV
jgi:hypothetical protein